MWQTTENYEITHERNFGPTKYSQENILDSQNTHEKKFGNHEIPTKKKFGLSKYPQEYILDLRNTHEKKFGTH